MFHSRNRRGSTLYERHNPPNRLKQAPRRCTDVTHLHLIDGEGDFLTVAASYLAAAVDPLAGSLPR